MLLDTHVLVHYAGDDRKLGKRTRGSLERALARNELFVSALSFWEIAMLVAKGRLALDMTVSAFYTAVKRAGIREHWVDSEIAIAAGELPDHHGDPIDRMLVATALVRGIALVTADSVLLGWDLRGLRVHDSTD